MKITSRGISATEIRYFWFRQNPADPALVVFTSHKTTDSKEGGIDHATGTDGNPLVREYRQPERLRAAIPQGDRLSNLPPGPFIGELSYNGIIEMLKDQRKWMTKVERSLVDDLTEYLRFKVRQLRSTNGQNTDDPNQSSG